MKSSVSDSTFQKSTGHTECRTLRRRIDIRPTASSFSHTRSLIRVGPRALVTYWGCSTWRPS